MTKEKIINIPNALSFYRILVFPLILWFLFHGEERMFAIFLCINLATDVLDGFIARTFNMVTKLGARIDSLGDYGTFILAFIGVCMFKGNDLAEHGLIFYVFIAMFIFMEVLYFIRFRTFSSLHLYSFKTTGYIQGVLFITWFFIGFNPWVYYFSMGFGILSVIETIIITFILKEKRSNAKGLYWILKENNA